MALTRRSLVAGAAVAILPLDGIGRRPARGALAADGFTVIEARPGRVRLAPPPAPETAVWTYDGDVPGPLLRVRKGGEVRVRLVNKLSQPTSLCWHGVRIANSMDGVAGLTQAPVMPGDRFDYRFTPPDAGFYWYHPHVFPHSAEQIGRGLFGLLIVDETEIPEVDRDMLVVLSDWSLDADGGIKDFADQTKAAGAGHVGSLVTVNGRPAPRPFEVRPGARVRLRILNACAARIAIMTLDASRVTVIAIDGQPSEVFPPAGGTIPVGPGSRFELIADMPREAGRSVDLTLRGEDGSIQRLLALATMGKPRPESPAAKRLPLNPLLPERIPLERAVKPGLVIGGGMAAPSSAPASRKGVANAPPAVGDDKRPWLWTLDGSGSNGTSGKPMFRVKRGGAVSLAFLNKTAFVQQMHIHGHVFRVLHDLDDGWDPYWRESILVAPGRTKHVAFIADNPGKWAVESLVLDRQVTGLAGWFEVE